MSRTLFQNAIYLSANPEIGFAMPMSGSEDMFWKRVLHKYVCRYAYVELFSNTQSMTLALPVQAHLFWKWRLEKSSSYLYICT